MLYRFNIISSNTVLSFHVNPCVNFAKYVLQTRTQGENTSDSLLEFKVSC